MDTGKKLAQIQAVCPNCSAQLNLQYEPERFVDLICAFSEKPLADTRPNIAGFTPDGCVIIRTEQAGKSLMFSVKLGQEVPVNGTEETRRFELVVLGPGVVKLRPSIVTPEIHAFVTIVNVPMQTAKK